MILEIYNSRTKELDNWLKGNPEEVYVDGELRKETLYFRGKLRSFQVYNVPLEYLRFNSENGRFIVEIRSLEAKKNIKLNPDNGAFGPVRGGPYGINGHAKMIMDLLLDMRKNNLEQEYMKDGQKRPLVVTSDGTVLNGNTRFALQIKKYNETNNKKYLYTHVIFLGKDLTDRDLYELECQLSIKPDGQEPYSDLNELLELKKGKDKGYSDVELANNFGVSKDKIIENILVIEFIQAYLEKFGLDPSDLSVVEGMLGQFRYTIRGMQKLNGTVGNDDWLRVNDFSHELIRILTEDPEAVAGVNIEGFDTNKRDQWIRPLFNNILKNKQGKAKLLDKIKDIDFEQNVNNKKILSIYEEAKTVASINGQAGLKGNVSLVCTKLDGFVEFINQGGNFPLDELNRLQEHWLEFSSYVEKEIIDSNRSKLK